jgi:hypothetical protein
MTQVFAIRSLAIRQNAIELRIVARGRRAKLQAAQEGNALINSFFLQLNLFNLLARLLLLGLQFAQNAVALLMIAREQNSSRCHLLVIMQMQNSFI